MDIMTNLSESAACQFAGILEIMDLLSMIPMNCLCQNNMDYPELMQSLFEHILWNRSVPDNVVTYWGTHLRGWFWIQVCSQLRTYPTLWRAFHPLTDRQMSHQDQVMKQYLRALCYYQQDNWVQLLLPAEFVDNDAIYTSTEITPFWAQYHYLPVMQFKAPKQPSSLKLKTQTDTFVAGLEDTYQHLHKNLQKIEAYQTKDASSKDVIFVVWDKVWLSTRYLWTTSTSMKLNFKWSGLEMVTQVINTYAC